MPDTKKIWLLNKYDLLDLLSGLSLLTGGILIGQHHWILGLPLIFWAGYYNGRWTRNIRDKEKPVQFKKGKG